MLEGFLRRSCARSAVVADFDGSLAPIVSDPAAAVALPASLAALESPRGPVRDRCSGLGPSGRLFSPRRLPIEGLTLVGQYGLECLLDGVVVVDPSVEPFLPGDRRGRRRLPSTCGPTSTSSARAASRSRCTGGTHPIRARPLPPGPTPPRRGWVSTSFPGGWRASSEPDLPIDKGTVLEGLVADCDAALFAGDDHGDLRRSTRSTVSRHRARSRPWCESGWRPTKVRRRSAPRRRRRRRPLGPRRTARRIATPPTDPRRRRTPRPGQDLVAGQARQFGGLTRTRGQGVAAGSACAICSSSHCDVRCAAARRRSSAGS